MSGWCIDFAGLWRHLYRAQILAYCTKIQVNSVMLDDFKALEYVFENGHFIHNLRETRTNTNQCGCTIYSCRKSLCAYERARNVSVEVEWKLGTSQNHLLICRVAAQCRLPKCLATQVVLFCKRGPLYEFIKIPRLTARRAAKLFWCCNTQTATMNFTNTFLKCGSIICVLFWTCMYIILLIKYRRFARHHVEHTKGKQRKTHEIGTIVAIFLRRFSNAFCTKFFASSLAHTKQRCALSKRNAENRSAPIGLSIYHTYLPQVHMHHKPYGTQPTQSLSKSKWENNTRGDDVFGVPPRTPQFASLRSLKINECMVEVILGHIGGGGECVRAKERKWFSAENSRAF